MRRLDRYLFSEILGPLGLGFLVYTFILLLRFLFQSAEMIIRRGVDVSVIGRLLLFTLPNIVVLTIPMALLFGILIAVGRLSADSELTAMRSCGVSLLSLYRPILLLSLLLTVLNTLLMVWALPWGNHGLQQLRFEILTQSVSRQVQPRVFYEGWEGLVLYVFEVPEGEEQWRGIFLAEAIPSTQENQVTVADRGRVKVDEAGERVVLELEDAYTHTVNLNEPASYEIVYHQRVERVLEEEFLSTQREKLSVSKTLRELTLDELLAEIDDPAANDEVRNLARVELHKKFAIPAACLVFGIFALPLGFDNRRGGKASGFALSILVILVYWVLLSNGEEAARFGRIEPWIAMWLPNILMASVGLALLLRRNRDKSLVLGRVDRWVREDLWRWMRRLPRRRQREASSGTDPEAARRQRAGLVVRLPDLRLPFPNILDRYVMRLTGRIFLMALLSGLALYIIADLSENVDEIFKNQISWSVVGEYYRYLSLQIFYDIAPILTLVTVLIAFSLLARSNEITICKALGVSLYRLSLPAIVVALVVVGLCAMLDAWVLPASNERVAQLNDQIRGRETARTYRRADRQWLFGQGRYVYNYLHYDPAAARLQRLQVFELNEDHRLARRLFAARAEYQTDDQRWIFSGGWARAFDGTRTSSFEELREPVVVDYPEKPDYFDSEVRPPEQMAYGELRSYIQELADSGQSVPELAVQLHNKIAYPAVSLVMALVALPFAFRLGRQGALYGIGLSLVLGMVFMAIFAIFITLGEAGVLPPIIAVWSPNAVFAVLALYLFLGVRS